MFGLVYEHIRNAAAAHTKCIWTGGAGEGGGFLKGTATATASTGHVFEC